VNTKSLRPLFCHLVIACLLLGFLPAAGADPVTETNADGVAKSLVKVFATVRYPDLYKPWAKGQPNDITGTGVVIDGKRILTCAHVALFASQIQVQANQAGDKVSASVEFVAPGIDLAILKLDDDTFFNSHPALPMSQQRPATKDALMVYGFPEGGNTLSITKGIVSRTEFTAYNYPVHGLRIQIDAAINPGNSGGPAVVGDKMIGLAFSHLSKAENIGYIIPCEEIQLFLQDIADGRYDGKPGMFDSLQTLENPALRAFLKIGATVQGMVVSSPAGNGKNYPLKQWDVITRIGDTPIDDQGMIKLDDNLRVHFQYEIQKLVKDGKVPLTVVRGGKELSLQLPVPVNPSIVLPHLGNHYPSYFVYGPMVFSAATRDFFLGISSGEYGDEYLKALVFRENPLITRFASQPAFEGEQLVVVPAPMFPHKIAEGYSNPFTQIVKTINGAPIKNLAHLVQTLRDCRDEFITIEFWGDFSESMVFRRTEMLAATDDILTDNGIRTQGSADMMTIWNAKPAK